MLSKYVVVSTLLMSVACCVLADDPQLEVENEYARLYASYVTASSQGDSTESLELAKQVLVLAEKIYSAPSAQLAILYHNLGNEYVGVGDRDQATKHLEKSLIEYEGVYGKRGFELVRVLFDLGDALAIPYDTSAQERHYRRALDIVKGERGKASYDFAFYNSMAGIKLIEVTGARERAAKQYIRKGYRIMKEVYGENSVEITYPALNMAKLYVHSQRKKRALKYLNKVVEILDQPSRDSNQVKLFAHGLLARIYTDLNKHEAATEHCIAISKMDPKSPDQDLFLIVGRAPKLPVFSSGASPLPWGTVELVFDVDEKGFVLNPKVVKNSGLESYKSSALDAVSSFRYAPAFVDGRAIRANDIKHKFRFGMDKPNKCHRKFSVRKVSRWNDCVNRESDPDEAELEN